MPQLQNNCTIGRRGPAHDRLNISKVSGLTIIELIAVVAIVSILALIATNAYSDYTNRAKVSEGINIASVAKNAVSSTYYTLGIMPMSNVTAGLPEPTSYATEIVTSLSVGSDPVDGTITIIYGLSIFGADNQLQLVPMLRSGRIQWQCQPAVNNGIEPHFLPPRCRL